MNQSTTHCALRTELARSSYLHFSGYDPRAAGGRQSIKLELPATFAEEATQIEVQLSAELLPTDNAQLRFSRAANGTWRPLFFMFSSKDKEHGQYAIALELVYLDAALCLHKWTCTTVILVPRLESSLAEIHQVFLGVQKNIKIIADDGSIAKVSATNTNNHGNMNIDLYAHNAGLAHLDLTTPSGKYEVAQGTIAWDEELIELSWEDTLIPSPALNEVYPPPCKQNSTEQVAISHASLSGSTSAKPFQVKLFALDQWILGRLDSINPVADILLSHTESNQLENHQLTRRLSARHALVRRSAHGFEIEDISRFG
ncbi:MAG: hypothetical protein K2P84_02690, partial [Undibacterium sp.]|nr:hypothetical protein [Undibacterium sp.]